MIIFTDEEPLPLDTFAFEEQWPKSVTVKFGSTQMKVTDEDFVKPPISLISFASADFFPLASSHFFNAALIVVGIFFKGKRMKTSSWGPQQQPNFPQLFAVVFPYYYAALSRMALFPPLWTAIIDKTMQLTKSQQVTPG